MLAAHQHLNFPVELRFPVTEEIARTSVSAVKATVTSPRMLILGLTLFGASMLWHVLHASDPSIAVARVLSSVLILGLGFWYEHWSVKKTQVAMLGKLITVRFFDDSFDFATGGETHRISYKKIARVGRDSRGLVMLFPRLIGLFIPTTAFASPEYKDFVFQHIGSRMKKK